MWLSASVFGRQLTTDAKLFLCQTTANERALSRQGTIKRNIFVSNCPNRTETIRVKLYECHRYSILTIKSYARFYRMPSLKVKPLKTGWISIVILRKASKGIFMPILSPVQWNNFRTFVVLGDIPVLI